MKSPDIVFVGFDAANTLMTIDRIPEIVMEISGCSSREFRYAWRMVNDLAETGRIKGTEASDWFADILKIRGPFSAEDHVFRRCRKPIVEMHEIMEKLAKRGVRVGIVSNAWEGMVPISINDGHLPNIPGMLRWESAARGFKKPDKEAWRDLAKLTRFPLQKMMIIDDDPKNIASAKGMFGEVFQFHSEDSSGSAMLLHARLVDLGLLG